MRRTDRGDRAGVKPGQRGVVNGVAKPQKPFAVAMARRAQQIGSIGVIRMSGDLQTNRALQPCIQPPHGGHNRFRVLAPIAPAKGEKVMAALPARRLALRRLV